MSDNILFLYSELAGYTVNCINAFAEENPMMTVYIVAWPINSEAPFRFSFRSNVVVSEKGSVDILGLIYTKRPKSIFCSGWFDKDYLAVIRTVYKDFRTVLIFDNYWEGTLKQNIGRFVLPYKVTRFFNFCWVPGDLHKKYALKIGFNETQVYLGFYATDLTPFRMAYLESLPAKQENYPKVFLYVGRYLTIKGIEDLWSAFIAFSKNNSDWELHCVGAGELFSRRVNHPHIVHHGFLQANELAELVKQAGVFILPSHYDHWGVAVQEFAAAGLPLICSNTVGAADAFLKHGDNGYVFEAKNVQNLQEAMHKMAVLPYRELLRYGDLSNKLSYLYTVGTWCSTLKDIIYNKDVGI